MILADVCRSRYLLYRELSDVFGPDKASVAVDVLLGPDDDHVTDVGNMVDEYQPTPDDLADYAEWAMAYEDRMWALRIESDGYISDRDVLVATGAVG